MQARIAIGLFLTTGSWPSLRREEGQTLVEYALILALIALAVVIAVGALSGKVEGIFNSVSSNL